MTNPDHSQVEEVLAQWTRRGLYHDRQRGLLEHHWPSMHRALTALARAEEERQRQASARRQIAAARTGIGKVIASTYTKPDSTKSRGGQRNA